MKIMMLGLVASAFAGVANAATLTENFNSVPGWEAGWFGTNSNAQNCYGVGAGRGNNPDGLWVSNGGCFAAPVNITFNTAFAASLSNFSIDVAGFSATTLSFFDKTGALLSATPVTLTFGAFSNPGVYSHYSVTSTNGIGGFSFTGAASGNTSIDNLNATVGARVPEPASWALMVTGFGLVGVAARRRKAVVAA